LFSERGMTTIDPVGGLASLEDIPTEPIVDSY
jgi:hypothetical protein